MVLQYLSVAETLNTQFDINPRVVNPLAIAYLKVYVKTFHKCSLIKNCKNLIRATTVMMSLKMMLAV